MSSSSASSIMKVFDGYGSFFALSHPLSRLLLIICTMLHPFTGASGLLCAAMVVLTRALLSFPSSGGELEIVNGLLFGMLLGTLYLPSPASVVIMALGAMLIVLTTACLSDTLEKVWRLPVLGLPYVISGYILLPVAAHLGLAPLINAPVLIAAPELQNSWLNLFAPLGSLYFNGTAAGGILVFLAFALSSRYLAVLTLTASLSCSLFLQICYLNGSASLQAASLLNALSAPPPLPLLIAQMNGVLTAGVIGGLYTVPSPRSILVAIGSALLACLITLFFQHTFWSTTFPPLALPFVLTTYLILLALSAARGGPWLRFWLITPALPELSLERLMIGRARGLDLHSVALRCPVSNSWQVYQGFDGNFTHKGPWRYALDLIQTVDKKSFKEDGSILSEYFSYCKPVLSPGWGTVAALVNNLADNQPGEVNVRQNWGNYLLIRLDNGPYVMLAHLQKGSIRVNIHSRVEPGQLLALCGNSGRSPQPHLHIHVQMSPEIGAPTVPFHLCHVLTSTVNGSSSYQLNANPGEGEIITATKRNAALSRALNLNVGRCFDYAVSEFSQGTDREKVKTIQRLSVKLDLAGQFYIEANTDRDKDPSRAYFSLTEDLLAFFDQRGQANQLLDTFILALGLTPLAEGNLSWQDQVPVRHLPAPALIKWWHGLLHPFSPCIKSQYTRTWDGKTRLWIQRGLHQLPVGLNCRWQTEAELSELSGIISLKLMDKNGHKLLTARLDGYGIREDNGIPESMLSRN